MKTSMGSNGLEHEDGINADFIRRGTPEEVRAFLIVLVGTNNRTLPSEHRPVVESFWSAAKLFACFPMLWSQRFVSFGTNIHTLPHWPVGGIGACLTTECPAMANGLFMFFDCDAIVRLGPTRRMVVFLEEFTHCFMNIGDESLVARVVCHMLPSVCYNDGKYSFSEQS